MGVLRGIEHGLESLFEGVFGRAFRSPVQPVELARKLAKEMDDNKAVSVSRVYAPNEYVVYLSPSDRAHYREYESGLLQELSGYLIEHARKEGYALLTKPRVLLDEDVDLAVGSFGIATRMVEPAQRQAVASPEARPGPQPPPSTEAPAPHSSPPVGTAANSAEAFLELAGTRYALAKSPIVIGRSTECDLVLDDPGASRKHAEVRADSGGHVIVDLDSTNGLEVNGRRTMRAQLVPGDVISVGQTELRFAR
ncbi:MAG: FhaA domain-containing protein [Gaiellales bacterium]